ncbi:hypothetical protein HKX69_05725 [Streptomyces argyrophyllae]|uniref:Uncharacterized protein n=1 Tax=Streptomyces argyrophylli TaxID=2726118 RepID=A0A6M4PDK1_9ACTN|nr:hypothetical protein [Streptomyces argyrophyllae]QJS09082.1 hypothetical protein HKX69_05725 [Streptomyces argyrophyllae]
MTQHPTTITFGDFPETREASIFIDNIVDLITFDVRDSAAEIAMNISVKEATRVRDVLDRAIQSVEKETGK